MAAALRLKLPLLATLVVLPLAWTGALAVAAGLDAAAWRALWADPQTLAALGLSLGTGLSATMLSGALAAWLLSRSFAGPRFAALLGRLAPLLAVPHAAFAIGLVLLISPSGWLLRALSPWATGFDAPPPWSTTQDPWGLGLVAVLVAKEVPFLLWTAATQLQREDLGRRWAREWALARSLGYGRHSAWWQVVWPQLWPRMGGPTLAVLAYSLTVVDMALVIGPAQPATLGVLTWQWLNDADVAINAQGAAAAWLLAGVVLLCAGLLWLLRPWLARVAYSQGRRGRQSPASTAFTWIGNGLVSAYAVVMLALALGSLAGVWPFPALWPQRWTLDAWRAVAQSTGTLWTTLWLGLAAALTALAWSVAWLELAPPAWDARLRRLVYLPLLLPAVLWVLGLHRLCLVWGWDARAAGLWLAHSLAALPYVLIALSPAYGAFDVRYAQLCASLGQRRWRFLLRVKWPLLKAALSAALAVGFAVSVAQYLPTLFIGGGRYASVTTEAVTLASGGQRSLTAAYAWLQWLLPVLGFALAAWVGRPRRFKTRLAA